MGTVNLTKMKQEQFSRENKQEPLKALAVTGYKCNAHCMFCSVDNKMRVYDIGSDDILGGLKKGFDNGCIMAELIGGEVTIRKDVITLIKKIKEIGYKFISIESNGMMFSNMEFTEKIISAGLTHVLFSIHGHNSSTHDSLTLTPGSFDQAIQGLINVEKFKNIEIKVNMVITKQNYKNISDFLELMSRFNLSNIILSCINPVGNALSYGKKIVPKVTDVSRFIESAFNKNDFSKVIIKDFPPCILDNSRKKLSGCDEPNTFFCKFYNNNFNINYGVEIMKNKPKGCNACSIFSNCDGIWKGYLDIYGDEEFKPILEDNLKNAKKD